MIFGCGKEETVAQGQAKIRRGMPVSGHFVVEMNGNQCDIRQEEEYDDGIKAVFSYIGHVRWVP